jgi:hypothetical protein
MGTELDGDPPSHGAALPHRVIHTARNEGFPSFGTALAVIRSQFEWEALLRLGYGRDPILERQTFDFQKEVVVLATHTESSGSIGVKFGAPVVRRSRVVIPLDTQRPDGPMTADMAYHFHVVAIPKTKLPVVMVLNGRREFLETLSADKQLMKCVEDAERRYAEIEKLIGDVRIEYEGAQLKPPTSSNATAVLLKKGKRLKLSNVKQDRNARSLVSDDFRRDDLGRFGEVRETIGRRWLEKIGHGSVTWAAIGYTLATANLDWWNTLSIRAKITEATVNGVECWAVQDVGDYAMSFIVEKQSFRVVRLIYAAVSAENSDFRVVKGEWSLPYKTSHAVTNIYSVEAFVKSVETNLDLADDLFSLEK